MKITVGIPTYNREIQLRKTLAKIINEATIPHPEFEILIFDNGAKDLNFPEFEGTDILLTYKRNSQNIGLSGNFSQLIKHAKGEYIWILSDDDIILENCLDNIYHQILNVDFDSGTIGYGDKNGIQQNNQIKLEHEVISSKEIYDDKWRDYIFISTNIFRTALARESLEFLESKKLVNSTYPQLLLIFHLATLNSKFILLSGMKILDSQPSKNYAIENHFAVKIRDLVLLHSQMRFLGVGNGLSRNFQSYAKSSVLNELVFGIFNGKSQLEIVRMISMEMRLIMSHNSRIKFKFYIFGFIPLQLAYIISPKTLLFFLSLVLKLRGWNYPRGLDINSERSDLDANNYSGYDAEKKIDVFRKRSRKRES